MYYIASISSKDESNEVIIGGICSVGSSDESDQVIKSVLEGLDNSLVISSIAKSVGWKSISERLFDLLSQVYPEWNSYMEIRWQINFSPNSTLTSLLDCRYKIFSILSLLLGLCFLNKLISYLNKSLRVFLKFSQIGYALFKELKIHDLLVSLFLFLNDHFWGGGGSSSEKLQPLDCVINRVRPSN